jgi:mitogen-activated protein kinase organizer 1
LTAGRDRSVRLWNPSRLDPAFPPPPFIELYGQDLPVSSLPRALPIQTYEDGIRHDPTALAVDDDSTRLLVASGKTAVLLDSVTAKVLRQWHGHTAVINSVAITADVLATASYDATVCLWDGRSNSHRPIQTLKEAKDSVTAVHILQCSIRTASVDGCVRTYDIRKGVLQCDDCHSPITSLAHSGSEHERPYLAISCLDGAIRVKPDQEGHDSYSSSSTSTLSVPLICRDRHTAGRYGLECCFSADASVIVSGSEDGSAILYDGRCNNQQGRTHQTQTAAVLQALVGHTAPTCSVAAHPKPEHSDVVITASYDGDCVVWANSRDYMRWED